ncbi:hypothetical protein [Formosa algae]|uniref:hypothetical protein n=1 Tax=Formosa algae TaxID=225843 RepID=UPI0011AF315E|nr:hypothetical protein [Formosa algae]
MFNNKFNPDMRYKDILKQNPLFFTMLSSLLILSSCVSSQDYAQQSNDGIYGSSTSNTVVYEDHYDTADNVYYKNYFKEKSQEIELYNAEAEQDSIFTDVDSYQSNTYTEEVYDDTYDNQSDYNGNGGWGQETNGVTVTIYNDPFMYGGFGYGYPYYGYGWGYAGWNRPYYGWGWGGGYYPPYYGGWGYGGGWAFGWGYPGHYYGRPGGHMNNRYYMNGRRGNNLGYSRGLAYNSNNRYLNSNRYSRSTSNTSSSRYQNLSRNSQSTSRSSNSNTTTRSYRTTRNSTNYSRQRPTTTSNTRSSSTRSNSTNRSNNTTTRSSSSSRRSYSTPSRTSTSSSSSRSSYSGSTGSSSGGRSSRGGR